MAKQPVVIMDKLKLFLGLDEITPITKKEKKSSPKVIQKKQSTLNLSYLKKSLSEVRIISPKAYSDATNVVNALKEDIVVVINFQYLDKLTIKRFMDFISGTIYSINGNLLKLSDSMLLLTSDKTMVSESTGRARSKDKTAANKEIIVNFINQN